MKDEIEIREMDFIAKQYAKSYKENGILEAAANIVAIMIARYSCMPGKVSAAMEKTISKMGISWNKFKKYKSQMQETEKEKEDKERYVIVTEPYIFMYLKALNMSEKYVELANYYNALRYLYGMTFDEFDYDIKQRVGMEMMHTQAEMGNKYASSFMNMVRGS